MFNPPVTVVTGKILENEVIVVIIKGCSCHQLRWGIVHTEEGCRGGRSHAHLGHVKFEMIIKHASR